MTSRLDPQLIPPSPDLTFESNLWLAGVNLVAGMDEAGRGAWAGPVAAAAVVLPQDPSVARQLQGVRDSKQLTPEKRSQLAGVIQSFALAWAVGIASPEEIDRYGIIFSTRLAMMRAMAQLLAPPRHLLIDALFLPEIDIPQTDLIKGDQRSLSIAAASILAKTARDAIMLRMEHDYPGYGFAAHKGYGTSCHRNALAKLGPCAEHRMSFSPMSDKSPVEIAG